MSRKTETFRFHLNRCSRHIDSRHVIEAAEMKRIAETVASYLCMPTNEVLWTGTNRPTLVACGVEDDGRGFIEIEATAGVMQRAEAYIRGVSMGLTQMH